MNINLTLWLIPAVAFLAAFLALARQIRVATSRRLSFEPAGKVKPAAIELPRALELARAAEEPRFDPLSRENFARISSRFAIRVISILPSTRRPGGRRDAKVEILVEFEPNAKLDYTVVFRLRQELFTIVGRHVDLVCRNSVELEARQEIFAKARVLYAA